MKPQSEHLSDAQVERYGENASLAEAAGVDSDSIEGHLAECSICSDRVLSSQSARFVGLADRQLNASPHTQYPETPDCPGEDALRELTAGLCSPELGTKLSRHAAQCDHCGPLLETYIEDFSEELSNEDQALLARLKTASPKGQRALAQRMLADSAQRAIPAKRLSWRWFLAPAAVAACALIAFFIWYQQRETPEKAEKLLAQAYTEKRTIEMRFPGAAYADFKQTRSGESASLLNSPEALRRATEIIAAHLQRHPGDGRWLLLSARLDLLDWRYKSALTTLNKIEDDALLRSHDFRMTRALTLYEQAEIERRPQLYADAVDLLGKILQTKPDDPVALFNQGLACERIYMFECAVADYTRFLKVDGNSAWAPEAREHLNRVNEKKNPENRN